MSNDSQLPVGDKEAIKKTSQCLRERIPSHQKARTLEMVVKKVKESEGQKSNESQSTETAQAQERPEGENVPSARRSADGDAEDIPCQSGSEYLPKMRTQEMTGNDTSTPRATLEPCVVSVTPTPTSPKPKVKLPNLEPLDGLESPSPIPFRLRHSSSRGSRNSMETWTPSIGSSLCNEDFASMAEMFFEEPQDMAGVDVICDNDSQTTSGADNVDGSLLPTAANLTRNVFDDGDMCKPLTRCSTKYFGRREGAQTTLNQTLSSLFSL